MPDQYDPRSQGMIDSRFGQGSQGGDTQRSFFSPSMAFMGNQGIEAQGKQQFGGPIGPAPSPFAPGGPEVPGLDPSFGPSAQGLNPFQIGARPTEVFRQGDVQAPAMTQGAGALLEPSWGIDHNPWAQPAPPPVQTGPTLLEPDWGIDYNPWGGDRKRPGTTPPAPEPAAPQPQGQQQQQNTNRGAPVYRAAGSGGYIEG